MGSNKKVFTINGCKITDIEICNKKMAYPIASKKANKKYRDLIKILTDLLVDDDDSGETCREALNQIEKFRQAVKFQETSQNKYILFLQYKMQTLMKENTSLRESVNKIYRNNK